MLFHIDFFFAASPAAFFLNTLDGKTLSAHNDHEIIECHFLHRFLVFCLVYLASSWAVWSCRVKCAWNWTVIVVLGDSKWKLAWFCTIFKESNLRTPSESEWPHEELHLWPSCVSLTGNNKQEYNYFSRIGNNSVRGCEVFHAHCLDQAKPKSQGSCPGR